MRERILSKNAAYAARVSKLLHELREAPEPHRARKPATGGWSAMQTAWHLMLVEESSMRYVMKKLGYGGDFRRPGLAGWGRMQVLRLAMILPFKYRSPKQSSGDNLPENVTLDQLQERWMAIRGEWTEFFEKMPANLLDKAVFKHPRAGRIGWLQMFDFFEYHFSRHLQQLRVALR